MYRFLEKLFEFCSSLKLAIVVILGIAFYLGAATFYEAQYGTRVVQAMVYGSTGFVVLMALLSINVMAAVLSRYPWKRRQTGFIITHCGIEILLAGCLLSFRYSVDGRVQLTPGSAADHRIDGYNDQLNVAITGSDGSRQTHAVSLDLWSDAGYPSLPRFVASAIWPLSQPRFSGPRTYELRDGARLQIMDWLPAAKIEQHFPPVENGWPAVHLRLAGLTPAKMPVDVDRWLFASSDAGASDTLFNGVISLELSRSNGPSELKEFLHPPQDKEAFKTDRAGTRGRLQLLQSGDKLYARILGLAGLKDAFEVTMGREIPAWMGLKLTFLEDVSSAREDKQFVPAHVPVKNLDQAMRAIRIAVDVDGQRTERWLARGSEPVMLQAAGETVVVSYGFESIPIPFQLNLKSAEQRNDPGSNNPANWTSVVSVGGDQNSTIDHTITMNEPLTVDGLTFYQAGFDQIDLPEGTIPLSTLSVRRDPGTIPKYIGCGCIVGGILTMFYMKAYFQKSPAPMSAGSMDAADRSANQSLAMAK
jgi:hypothetical protein